jgi:hypothetical protein
MKVDRGRVRAGTVLNDIDRIREQGVLARADRSPEPAPTRTPPISPRPRLTPRYDPTVLREGNRLGRRGFGIAPRGGPGPRG